MVPRLLILTHTHLLQLRDDGVQCFPSTPHPIAVMAMRGRKRTGRCLRPPKVVVAVASWPLRLKVYNSRKNPRLNGEYHGKMAYNHNGRYVNDIVVLSLWLISMNELGERTLIHNISVILSFTMVYRIIQWFILWTFQDPKMELRL